MRRPRRAHVAVVTTVAAIVALAIAIPASAAAPGELDPTFHPAGSPPGTATTAFGDFGYANRVVALSDGGALVVGSAEVGGDRPAGTSRQPFTGANDFAVARYFADGTLDTSLDGTPLDSLTGDGILTIDFGGGYDEAFDVTVIANRIILAGTATIANDCGGGGRHATPCSTDENFAIAVLHLDGTPDAGFGTGGLFTVDLGDEDVATGVAVQSDGEIVLGGYTTGGACTPEIRVVRLNPNDATPLDSSYGDSGVSTGDVTGFANDLALAAGDKAVLVGTDLGDMLVARFTASGDPDPTFGSGGVRTASFSGYSEADGVAIDRGQNIVAAGWVIPSGGGGGGGGGALPPADRNVAVARFTPSGGLDPLFSSNGKVVADLGGDEMGGDVVLDPSDRVVVGGTASGDFALFGFDAFGALDPSFGESGGVTLTDLNSGGGDFGAGLALDPNDAALYLAGGTTVGAGPSEAAVARYGSTPTPGPGESPPPPPTTSTTDFSMTKVDSPDPVTSGDDVNYQITALNNGPEGASDVTVTDTLPTNVTIIDVTPSAGTCTTSSNIVTCHLGAVAAGATAGVSITVKTPILSQPATISDRATLSSDGDHNPANNTAVQVTTIEPKNAQDHAEGFIPPEGGRITTDKGRGATKGDPYVLTMILGPGPGGVATLDEVDCPPEFAPCIGGTVGDLGKVDGFIDIRGIMTYDRSVTHGIAPHDIQVLWQQIPGDPNSPVIVLEQCGDPRVPPCVIRVHRLGNHDVRVRVFLGTDPRMGTR